MVGITKSRWLTVGLGTIMAASLVVGGSAVAFAQEEEECPPAEVTGVIPDLTEELGRKPKVGLVMKSLANEFFQQMDAGAKAFAAENAELFDFETVGMQDERDFAAQVAAIENYITKQFDVIVIAPADSRAMVEPLAQAIDAGITVVNIDVALDETAKEEAGVDLAFFGPDNRAGAKLAGDELGKLLGEGGKVVILEGNPEADNAVQRQLGFVDSVEEYGLDLLESRTANWETELANGVMTDYLTKYPDVQGVMAANDSMALGVVAALEAADKVGDIAVVGFDNIPGVRPLVADGSMLATIEQFGANMAVFGIEFGLRELAGESFCGWQKTPIELVTAENVVVE
ncbi:MAG: sugar ABC transporter substrate-binding protein [Chloroflexota bacterium]|jgi:ribose transport system substrate-binding protein